MRISDWSSDVCSSDLSDLGCSDRRQEAVDLLAQRGRLARQLFGGRQHLAGRRAGLAGRGLHPGDVGGDLLGALRSEEHTSELQSLMRISYDVFCLKKKQTRNREVYVICINYYIQYLTTQILRS